MTRNLTPFPMPACSVLEPSDFSEAMLDIRKFLIGFTVSAVTGFGIGLALFVCFFVEIH